MAMLRRPVRVATVSHRPSTGVDSPAGMDRLIKGAQLYIERAARMGEAASNHLARPSLLDHLEPHQLAQVLHRPGIVTVKRPRGAGGSSCRP
jgi:hypothetical protein